MSLPRIRTVPTASGATAVRVIWRYVDNRPVLDYVGSAHSVEDLALLVAEAQRLIDGDQLALDLDSTAADVAPTGSVDGPLEVTTECAGFLLDAIGGAFCLLGLDAATSGDSVFYDLVAARDSSPRIKVLINRNARRSRRGFSLISHPPAVLAALGHR